MAIIDKRYKAHPWKYIFQSFLAMMTLLSVLSYLDMITHTAIISSFGATVFIVFTMPRRYHSDARRLIGGYMTGIIIGLIFHFISWQPNILNYFDAHHLAHAFFGSVAVFFTILFMVILDTEHPPACGIALGIVLNPFELSTIIFVITVIIIMTLIKNILKPVLIDLI